MRWFRPFVFLVLAGLSLLLLGRAAAAEAQGAPGTASNHTDEVQLDFLSHPKEVERDQLSNLSMTFSTAKLKVAEANLSFQLAWTRVDYHEAATQAVKELNESAALHGHQEQKGREGGGEQADRNETEIAKVELKHKFVWQPLTLQPQFNDQDQRWHLRLAGVGQAPPGYYLLRLEIRDRTRDNLTLAWFYSREPLKVYLTVVEEPVRLNLRTFPDFEQQRLDFQISYEGPFLEHPAVHISGPTLGLKELRVNVSGLMQARQGQLSGNLSFAPLPLPQGTFQLTLKGLDAAGHQVVVHSQFTLKALTLAKDQFTPLSSDSGKLDLALAVKLNLSLGRLSLEELEANPAQGPNNTRLLERYRDQLAPGGIRAIGRYLAVEPSTQVRQQLDNATLRFWVNQTDLDEAGEILGPGVFGLRVFYFNESAQEWELVEASGYDRQGYVWAYLPHFSLYALFGTNVAPTATADPGSLAATVDEPIQISGSGADLDGTIVEWAWDFDGDGTYDVLSNRSGSVTHTYTRAGSYSAKLRVTDEQGATGFAYISVTVSEPESGTSSGLPLPLHVTLAAVLVATLMRRRR